MLRRKSWGLAVAACAVSMLAFASSASATFHLMKIREVNASGPNYVELQMHQPGQNMVINHSIFVYGAAGNVTHVYTMPNIVQNFASQSTILIGDPNVAAGFGVAPDFVDGDLDLTSLASGGAVCFADSEPPDCVAWGGFTPQPTFPDPAAASSPVARGGIPTTGLAASRSIARGCPTLLEQPADDAGPSSVDFSLVAPHPRNNATPPTEHPCGGGGGGSKSSQNCKKAKKAPHTAKKRKGKKCKKRHRHGHHKK